MPDLGGLNLLKFFTELEVLLLVNRSSSCSSAASMTVLLGVPGLGGEFVRDVRDEREDKVKPFDSALDAVVVLLGFGMPSY
jgi:hypothetical protein